MKPAYVVRFTSSETSVQETYVTFSVKEATELLEGLVETNGEDFWKSSIEQAYVEQSNLG